MTLHAFFLVLVPQLPVGQLLRTFKSCPPDFWLCMTEAVSSKQTRRDDCSP